MSSTATSTAPLLYVDCNVPDADMVAEWRRGNGGSTRPRVVRTRPPEPEGGSQDG